MSLSMRLQQFKKKNTSTRCFSHRRLRTAFVFCWVCKQNTSHGIHVNVSVCAFMFVFQIESLFFQPMEQQEMTKCEWINFWWKRAFYFDRLLSLLLLLLHLYYFIKFTDSVCFRFAMKKFYWISEFIQFFSANARSLLNATWFHEFIPEWNHQYSKQLFDTIDWHKCIHWFGMIVLFINITFQHSK